MCGIAGFLGAAWPPDESRDKLARMLRSILHRGPDELGAYFDDQVGLACARLSIIDLASGQQPMSSPDGRWWIVFNGEIFNYLELREELRAKGVVFRTRSDTEVLLWSLVTWGVDALPKLNGQFAFALWDRRERSLFLARDRFGERPLFYHQAADGFFAFASEIKGLFALPEVPRALDPQGLRQACHFWTALPGVTCFQGISSLPPGSWAVLDGSGQWRQGQYHTFPRRQPRIAEHDAIDMVREKVERAVEIRMRGDVEIALYLSGGLDSTITSTIATKLANKSLRTFSVAFKDAAFDESGFQQQAAECIGAEHHALTIDNHDIRACFPDVIRHAETVLFRTAPAPLYLLAREVNRAGIKVVLTGEGADELFLGYDIFKEASFLSQFGAMTSDDERLDRLQRLYPYLPHFNAAHARSLLMFYRPYTSDPGNPLLSHLPRFANGSFAAKLVAGPYDPADGIKILLQELRRTYPDFDDRGLLERTQILELSTLLEGYLLSSQGDRMTSASSVEGRYPFLDSEVSDLASALPEELLLRGNIEEKYVLKRAFADILPTEILSRPKQPYRAPGSSCLRVTKADDWLSELLREDRIGQCSAIDQKVALSLVRQVERTPDEQISPRLDHAYVALVSTLLLDEVFVKYEPALASMASLAMSVVDGRQHRSE